MKQTIMKYLACAGMVCSLAACDDWLGNQPKGEMIPETLSDYQMLLNGQSLYRSLDVYPLFFTDDIRLTGRGEIQNTNASTGAVTNYTSFDYMDKSQEMRNAYSFAEGDIFLPSDDDAIWNDGYEHIFTYNAIINNVLATTDGKDTDRKRVWGEALVGRAFEYLNLVNLYGNHYDAETADTDYGVPLVLSEVMTGEQYPRASVAEVYRQIEEDLNEAVPCLAKVVNHPFAPSQSVGQAFLSRMYLYMGRYEEALTNANAALESNSYLIDLTEYEVLDHGTFGRIVRSDNGEEYPDPQDNEENIYTRTPNNTSYLFAAVAASDDLLETFRKDLTEGQADMRKELYYCTDSCDRTINGGRPDYFRGFTTYMPYVDMNVGLGTPEIYLIAAECEARVGDVDRALERLNTLRDKRIRNNVHYATPTSLSREEVLRLVIDERRREFAFVGLYRLIDLKRMNRESWFAKTITHTAGNDGSWTLPPNDPRYIFPVPERVISFNPMPEYDR